MFTEKLTMSWNSQKVVKLAFEASQPPEILHASVTFAYVTKKTERRGALINIWRYEVTNP